MHKIGKQGVDRYAVQTFWCLLDVYKYCCQSNYCTLGEFASKTNYIVTEIVNVTIGLTYQDISFCSDLRKGRARRDTWRTVSLHMSLPCSGR